MKAVIITLLVLFVTGCATTHEPTKAVKLTEEQCSEQGGIIIQTDTQSPLRCLGGSRTHLIARTN